MAGVSAALAGGCPVNGRNKEARFIMKQRIITGAVLVALLIVLLYFGGAVMSISAMVCICFAVYEEYHALALAGHRPVSWPT